MAEESNSPSMLAADCPFSNLPDHLLIDIFVRVPIVEWGRLSSVHSCWNNVLREECFWRAALIKCFPSSIRAQKWPGPIPRGVMSKRRFVALYTSKCMFCLDDELSEIVGHIYLYLKEQLGISNVSPSGILHGTIIDQFIACGELSERAYELASLVWCAVIDNLEESHQTFLLLKGLATEGEVFLPYPYSRSYKVEWKIFERLFTDFRDCLQCGDYYDLLGCAKQKFQPIPATWLGY